MNPSVLIDEFVSECWERVFGEVRDAAVFIDHVTAECLHWYTSGNGYLKLKNAGAIIVQELAMYNFRYAEVKGTKKMLIISSSNDLAFYRRTIKMILAKNAFEICRILCTAEPYSPEQSDHQENMLAGRLDYTKLNKNIKDWMSAKHLAKEPLVSISFLPMFTAVISNDIFVTPPFANIMPPVGSNMTDTLALRANSLADALGTFLEHINVCEDVYYLGNLSKLIAEKLVASPSHDERKKGLGISSFSSTRMSLILIDRTLDLCTPTSHDTECSLSKLLSAVPRLPNHSNDVSISISRLFCQPEEMAGIHEVPGCLASMNRSIMDQLISREPKKVLLEANQVLNDALTTKESPQAKGVSRVSVHTLQKLIDKLRVLERFDTVAGLRQKGQLTMAIIESTTSQNSVQLELLTSLEKLILQNISVSGDSTSILTQLSNVIRTRTSRGLNTENLLALLIHVYDLAGVQIRFAVEQERQLEGAIADAIYEDILLLRENQRHSSIGIKPISSYQQTLLLLGINDERLDNNSVRQLSEEMSSKIMQLLQKISTQRTGFQNYRSLISRTNTSEPARRVPLVEQVTKSILERDTGNDLSDLQQSTPPLASIGLTSFLRGRTFTKTHPRDNPWILIYVVGGITPEEVKIVRALVRKYSDAPSITLAGSQLLQPIDVVDKVFLSSNRSE